MELKYIFKKVYEVSKSQGVEVYAVGGFVRDSLLNDQRATINEQKKDIDFVVVGSGLEFARAFDEAASRTGSLVEFPDFDTARYVIKIQNSKFKTQNENLKLKTDEYQGVIELEFAGARSEKYDENSRKPKVEATSLDEDLKRRDFTVNAMAQKVGAMGLSKKIIDPFGGQEDLNKKIIKTPLDSDITFSEDPLRMMRAARFASQLDFEIEPATLKALFDNRKRLKIISAERICEELFKLLGTKKPSVGLWILYNTQLLDEFLPEVSQLYGVEEVYGIGHKNNLNHTFRVVDNVAERSKKVVLRFAALMHDIGKPGTKEFVKGRGWAFDMHEHLGRKIVRQIAKRLRMSKDDTEYIAKLVRWHQQPIALMDEGVTDSPVRRLIVNLQDNLDDLLILCRSDITTGNPQKLEKRLKNYDYLEKRIAEVIEKDKLRAFQSPVRGEEIMKECGLKPGPTVGKIKKALEDAILDGKISNEHDATHEYFLSIKDDFMESVGEWERVS
ncbi:MAG: HD domain-containing protein [Candidatus Magasanikbacteria bacterium]